MKVNKKSQKVSLGIIIVVITLITLVFYRLSKSNENCLTSSHTINSTYCEKNKAYKAQKKSNSISSLSKMYYNKYDKLSKTQLRELTIKYKYEVEKLKTIMKLKSES